MEEKGYKSWIEERRGKNRSRKEGGGEERGVRS